MKRLAALVIAVGFLGGIALSHSLAKGPPEDVPKGPLDKVLIAHIADVEAVLQEPGPEDPPGTEVYKVIGYYVVIEVSTKAAQNGHAGHVLEMMGVEFKDIIPYVGTKGEHFTVEEIVVVPPPE
jgi:hypothetical protein